MPRSGAAGTSASPAAEMNVPVWHAVSAESALEAVRASPHGLDGSEAALRLQRYGPNTLVLRDPDPAWKLLLAQGKSLVVLLLLAAAGIALLLGDLLEAAAIAAVLIANMSIGFWVEWKARNAMEALRRTQVSEARVRRNGEASVIDAREVVPGDIVLLEAGEAVPADARLLSTNELRLVEAPLTGESAPVSKEPKPIGDPADEVSTALAERSSMVYKGTLVASGSGRGVVIGTGRETEIGRIAELVQATQSEETPLENRLDALGRRLVWITLVIAAVVTGLGVVRGGEAWLMLQTGIALAIAAVPEGLPVVATITLALGMRRMARRRALVRSLPAVETLGSATVICADKTGTLTGGWMTATRIEVADLHFEVSETGLHPHGDVAVRVQYSAEDALGLALRIGVLTNRATLKVEDTGTDPGGVGGAGVRIQGDPTEGALLVLGRKAGLERETVLEAQPELGEVPFTSERSMMATFHQVPDGGRVAYVKGAPGRIVAAAQNRLSTQGPVSLDEEGRKALLERNRELASKGLRVLALAVRNLPPGVELDEHALVDLTFVGFVGIEDPPAPGVRETIDRLREAGVRTVMITGDQSVTATAIGGQLGLDPEGSEPIEGKVLSRMSDEDLAERVEGTSIFSRVTPADKLRIVEAFQRRGEIVAMLGDGVNDAPALKRADIGVAMGGRGTDVAKETAGVVLQDDRFETIGAAVEEGRVIFDNIRKFVFYLFSCNLSEVLVILVAGVAGLPLPLLPLQILWLNLVTDVFPALALAVEPPEEDVMARPPRSPDAAILSRSFLALVAQYGLVITISTLSAYLFALRGGGEIERAITIAFMTLALAQLFHVFNARRHDQVFISRRLFQNGWVWSAVAFTLGLQLMAVYFGPLSRVLETVPLSTSDWSVVVAAALVPLLLGQLGKTARASMSRPAPSTGEVS